MFEALSIFTQFVTVVSSPGNYVNAESFLPNLSRHFPIALKNLAHTINFLIALGGLATGYLGCI